MPIRQCYNQRAMSLRGRAQGHDQTAIRRTCEIGEQPFKLTDIARVDRLQLHLERWGRGLHSGKLADAGDARASGVLAKNDPLDARMIASFVAIMPTLPAQRQTPAAERLAEVL